MNVAMSGVDYKTAPIEIREKLALAKPDMERVYAAVKAFDGVSGAVIISTCNRTEIYLSLNDGARINPFEALCGAAGLDFERFGGLCYNEAGTDVMRHLCELACGVKSQIWGEDQIITQVRNAIETAREYGASDAMLEVMFRNAVTAAKKVKSSLQLNLRGNSAVHKTLDIMREYHGVNHVLVIGNGEIGKLAARMLIDAGYSVTVTLRHYRHGVAGVPDGAATVDYSERYGLLPSMDAVISATSSPHHTVEYDTLAALERFPTLFFDLAVPRDVDPRVETLAGVTVYNIDGISAGEMRKNHDEQMERIAPIVLKYIDDFKSWMDYRNRLVSV